MAPPFFTSALDGGISFTPLLLYPEEVPWASSFSRILSNIIVTSRVSISQ
jgi:hypothetical protein